MILRPESAPIFFKDKRTRSYLDSVILLSRQHRPPTPFEGPLMVTVTFVMPRPFKFMGSKYPDGLMRAPYRPDSDNLFKPLADALTKAGFWHDDAQITDPIPRKRYAEKTGKPRIMIQIQEVQWDASQ